MVRWGSNCSRSDRITSNPSGSRPQTSMPCFQDGGAVSIVAVSARPSRTPCTSASERGDPYYRSRAGPRRRPAQVTRQGTASRYQSRSAPPPCQWPEPPSLLGGRRSGPGPRSSSGRLVAGRRRSPTSWRSPVLQPGSRLRPRSRRSAPATASTVSSRPSMRAARRHAPSRKATSSAAIGSRPLRNAFAAANAFAGSS